MNLKAMSNERLLSDLKTKVDNERKLLMEILYALREVEIRKLHLELGYPDLYTFAMKELGYSSGSAYRRIAAMRLLQAVPEAASKLESGELGLENASQAQSYFRKEDQRRKEQGEQKLTFNEKREVVTELLGKSSREGLRVLMDRSPEVMVPTEKTRPLSDGKTLIQFVAGAELMEKLEELKQLMAHKNYEGRLDVLIDQLADIALKELKPSLRSSSKPDSRSQPAAEAMSKSTQLQLEAESESRSETDRPSKVQPQKDLTQIDPSPAPGMIKNTKRAEKPSRYIPVKEKRKVILRDRSGCTFQNPKTGSVCGSKHGLQLDHIKPFSLGGPNTAENLTLRCGAHNRYRAEQMGLGLKH